jgi:hypothetical protein
MARTESEREDLLREATALVERAELQVAEWEEPVVAGFRRDGSASFYFGGEPVYQFNTARELRRGYGRGLLYKAERGRLIAMRRERTAEELALVRSELSPEETARLLAEMQERLTTLRAALAAHKYRLIGQVPPEGDMPARLLAWLSQLPAQPRIAASQNVR